MVTREVIHDALLTIAEAGPFYPVTFRDPLPGQMTPRMEIGSEAIRFASCETDEVRLELETPVSGPYGRKEIRRHLWEMHLSFDGRTDIAEFLAGFSRTVARQAGRNPQFQIEVGEVGASHPPRVGEGGSYFNISVTVTFLPT